MSWFPTQNRIRSPVKKTDNYEDPTTARRDWGERSCTVCDCITPRVPIWQPDVTDGSMLVSHHYCSPIETNAYSESGCAQNYYSVLVQTMRFDQ